MLLHVGLSYILCRVVACRSVLYCPAPPLAYTVCTSVLLYCPALPLVRAECTSVLYCRASFPLQYAMCMSDPLVSHASLPLAYVCVCLFCWRAYSVTPVVRLSKKHQPKQRPKKTEERHAEQSIMQKMLEVNHWAGDLVWLFDTK